MVAVWVKAGVMEQIAASPCKLKIRTSRGGGARPVKLLGGGGHGRNMTANAQTNRNSRKERLPGRMLDQWTRQ